MSEDNKTIIVCGATRNKASIVDALLDIQILMLKQLQEILKTSF